jgi:hypothetical protein
MKTLGGFLRSLVFYDLAAHRIRAVTIKANLPLAFPGSLCYVGVFADR